ncbi:putative skeletal organic matrix protein 5 isoform X1 [Oculina patagonica]
MYSFLISLSGCLSLLVLIVLSSAVDAKRTKCCKQIKALLEDMKIQLDELQNTVEEIKNETTVEAASSCKELFTKHKSSNVFTLMFGSQKIPVYCHMGNFGCGDGGWTPAMKIDGNKGTFHYDSHFWSDRNASNLAGGLTGFDNNETKLPTYWNTPFSKICLGMKIGQELNFIVINKQANSLYTLIADGQYRNTTLGRDTWKKLIGSQASLQRNCNREGFNAVSPSDYPHSKARIGIVSNEQNDCNSCDSRIGFGTGGYPDDSNTCGNEASHFPDNGDKHIKAMGYILVQ